MRHLLFIFAVCLLGKAGAQNCYKLEIQESNKKYSSSKFYFKSVIDARPDTSAVIGEVYIGSLNFIQCASFKKNVSTTLLSFLQETYPNKAARAYLVKINKLNVGELIHKNKSDTGFVNASLDFYRYESNNDLTYITSVSKNIQDVYEDATYSHDNRLKRIFLSCVSEFENALKTDSTLFTLKTSKDEIKKLNTAPPDTSVKKNPVDTKEPSRLYLQLQGHHGLNVRGCGVKLGAYFFLKKNPKVAFGPGIFWDYFVLYNTSSIPKDVVSLGYKIGDIGLVNFNRINKYFGITIDNYFLFGAETVIKERITNYYTYDPTTSTLYYNTEVSYPRTVQLIGGFHAEQGVQFMRKEKRGVNLKLSIYETILTADYYETDFGVKLSCGINF